MGRTFGVVQSNAQLNFASIESALDEAWMVVTHNIFAKDIYRLDSPIRGVGVVSQFAANPGLEYLDVADFYGIDTEHVVTQQYHVGKLPRGDQTFFVLLKFGVGRPIV